MSGSLNQTVEHTDVSTISIISLSSNAGLICNNHTIQVEVDAPGTGTFEIWARVQGATAAQKLTQSIDNANIAPINVNGLFDQIEIRPVSIGTSTTHSVFISSRY